MNLSYKIVETATEMFAKRGIKVVSVDEIASELGISKRTLYEQVKSKDYLVEQCIVFFHNNCKKRYEEIEILPISVFERIIKMIETQLNIIRSTNKNFLNDIIDYAKGKGKIDDEERQKKHDYFVSLVKEGQENGEIIKEFDPKIIVKIIEAQMMSLGHSALYDFSQISFFEVYRTLWAVSLNGIATEKGRQIIKTLKI